MRSTGIRVLGLAMLSASIFLMSPGQAVMAEVGGMVPPGGSGGPANSYVFSIMDGSEPILGIWSPVYPTGGPGIVLNPNGAQNGDGAPALLHITASGLTLVAWARNSASGFDVVLSAFGNGAWSEPTVIAGTTEDELDPFLFAGPDGSVHLLYWIDDSPSRVMYTFAPPDLSSWSVHQQVSHPDDNARRPAGVFFEGAVRAAYEVHNFGPGRTPRQVILARKEGDGFVPEVMAMTSYAGEVRPQPHTHAGRLWVDWIDADGEAAWIRMDANGQWEDTRYEPFANLLEREFLVRRAIQMQAIE